MFGEPAKVSYMTSTLKLIRMFSLTNGRKLYKDSSESHASPAMTIISMGNTPVMKSFRIIYFLFVK